MRCAIFGCNSDNESKNFQGDIKFHTFPRKADIVTAWKIACRRKDNFNIKNAYICNKHFSENDYVRNLKHELLGYKPKNWRGLKEDAIPTLNLPGRVENPDNNNDRKQREELRIKRKNQLELIAHILTENDEQNRTNTEHDDRDNIIKAQQEKIAQLERERKAIEGIFTTAQLKKIIHPDVRPRWTIEDVSKAIILHSAGPRAYRLLLKKNLPFPAVSTLRKWLSKIKIVPGILSSIFDIIKRKEMNVRDKICILSFDEMKLRKEYTFDKADDEILSAFSYAQVVMLRGLHSKWKQPIFFGYDCKLTKSILFEIIEYVQRSGFDVVGVVSDLGGGNRSLHNELEVNENKTWFINPSNKEKIFVFADVPHLIKLIRNNFVDHGFIFNGKQIGKKIVERLTDETNKSDVSITYKISKEDLNCKDARRQKVKLATKLFSHTISCALTRCGMNGKMDGTNWQECADFFKQVND
ncbi:hypothetical protein ABEB36_009589 [Hypothenemus hampei]|uniref:THAP-type domain-containing protein n=1 Tax=Hypothenemus hampei TaxID=57062 RepID=A0ABD1EGT4_HYPHA